VLVAATNWYLILCSVMMVVQYFIERHFAKGYGRTERARLRLRAMNAETGGRV
jgi:polar amino acid transport system permease protein